MYILAELHTQRKGFLKKGEENLSHMVEPSFEELMAGRVHPSHGRVPGPQGLWCKRVGGGHVFHPTTADKLHSII
jgi:hypothetical protein